MTEYEIADLAASKIFQIQGQISLLQVQVGTIADGIQQFMTILFGYIAAAYFVGSTLERRQMWIFTGIYVLWQFWVIATIAIKGNVLYLQLDRLTDFQGTITVLGDTVPVLIRGTLIMFLLAALIASLYFMWSIRHPKTQ